MRPTLLSRRYCLLRRYSSATEATTTERDSICELAASNLRYGPGATAEVGQDLAEHFQCRHVAVFTDTNIRRLDCFHVVRESLERSNVSYTVFDQVRVEPNDVSFRQAADFLQNLSGGYDGVVALGGGSVIDTAKAANLYACHPPIHHDFYDYVNPPIGRGLPIPGKVNPLIAIPTTAGTGSETTGVAIFDDSPTRSKTGIANRHLKPALGILDPNNLRTLPTAVAKYSGLDVLCHALESFTALPFNQRIKPTSPLLRPAYQGSNPISDVWSIFALQTAAMALPQAVQPPENEDPSLQQQARSQMLLASAAAGMGFGNAGVHLCHGMSYPISSQASSARYTTPADYIVTENEDDDNNSDNNTTSAQQQHALIPHGLSVIVSAPTVFTWTGETSCPDRHARAAEILRAARWQREGKTGCSSAEHTTAATSATTTTTTSSSAYSHPGLWLADEIRDLCHLLQVPLGLKQFGYTEADIPALVQGTLPQHRVTKISPRQPVEQPQLEHLFQMALMEGEGDAA